MFSGLSTHTAVNVECSRYRKCQVWFSPVWQYEELKNNGQVLDDYKKFSTLYDSRNCASTLDWNKVCCYCSVSFI